MTQRADVRPPQSVADSDLVDDDEVSCIESRLEVGATEETRQAESIVDEPPVAKTRARPQSGYFLIVSQATFRKLGEEARGPLSRLVSQPADLDDAVQEGLTHALEELRGGRQMSVPYAMRAVVNKTIDGKRKMGRYRKALALIEQESGNSAFWLQEENMPRLRRVLERLPQHLQAVLFEYFILEKTAKESAESLGISEAKLKHDVRAAAARVRKEFEGRGGKR